MLRFVWDKGGDLFQRKVQGQRDPGVYNCECKTFILGVWNCRISERGNKSWVQHDLGNIIFNKWDPRFQFCSIEKTPNSGGKIQNDIKFRITTGDRSLWNRTIEGIEAHCVQQGVKHSLWLTNTSS